MTAVTRMRKEPQLDEGNIPRVSGRYTITPKIATAWLDYCDNVRTINLPTIAVYARDMKNGHWIENDEAIHWSDEPEPKCINGEHRLRACILADTPFVSRVAIGVPREAARTFDLGRKRSTGSILAMDGERYANHLAASATILWRWRQSPRSVLDGKLRPSMHDILDTIEQNPALRTSVELVHGSFPKASKLARSATVPVLIHHEGSRTQGEAKATEFIEQIHQGYNLEPGTAAYALRERLIPLQGVRNTRVLQHDMLALWIPAWNRFVAGKTVKRLDPVDWHGDEPIEIF